VDIRVSALCFYPVKACGGTSLARASAERRGLRYDRRWMIVDGDGVFVTQRTVPRLALVDVRLSQEALVLSAPGMPDLEVPVDADGPRRRVRVWRDEVPAVDCGGEARAWISRWIDADASLVMMPDDVERPVNPARARPGDVVGFADSYPVLVASTSSLDNLNRRLPDPVPMARFRANIVVSGAAAWAEDSWTRIAIGRAAVLRVAKPCDRCVVTTVDPATGEKGVEPLRTLSAFRKSGNEVLFAMNCIPEVEGEVCVGDEVTVLETGRGATGDGTPDTAGEKDPPR
jgi:uncharacterized protein YcbX